MNAAPQPRSRWLYLETFGCQMNQADSELILARLAEAGYLRCERLDDADLAVLDTCSVRDHAEARVRGRLDALRTIKQQRPSLRIAVVGCMAQRLGAGLIVTYPQVDLVVGTDRFVDLPALLQRLQTVDEPLVEVGRADFDRQEPWSMCRAAGVNAWVPIMRGCNYRCTYCVVPYTRGSERSRSVTAISAEVRAAVDQGHVQVTLLGQTVDAYGRSLGDGSTLAGLLRRLNPIPGLLRLRFVTSHPKDITDDLLDAVAELPKVAKHLHIPVQSGSDRILRLMGRRHDRGHYQRLVEQARARVPGLEILTDLIVGFPTESDQDFAATRSLLESVDCDGAFVFKYSPRPGTAAASLPDDVPAAVKKERCNDLIRFQLAAQERQHRALVGTVQQVLVEGPSRNRADRLAGRSQGNRRVVFPRRDAAGESRDVLIGSIVPVRIAAATNLTLLGELEAAVGQTQACFHRCSQP